MKQNFFQLYLVLAVLQDILLAVLLFLGSINLLIWFAIGAFLKLKSVCFVYGTGAQGLYERGVEESIYESGTMMIAAVNVLTLLSILLFGWQNNQFPASLLFVSLSFVLSNVLKKIGSDSVS